MISCVKIHEIQCSYYLPAVHDTPKDKKRATRKTEMDPEQVDYAYFNCV